MVAFCACARGWRSKIREASSNLPILGSGIVFSEIFSTEKRWEVFKIIPTKDSVRLPDHLVFYKTTIRYRSSPQDDDILQMNVVPNPAAVFDVNIGSYGTI